jgi:hypothetical protein
MSLAPSAIPPNPKIAAMIAITKNVMTHRIIMFGFLRLILYNDNQQTRINLLL